MSIFHAWTEEARKIKPEAERLCNEEAQRRGFKDWVEWRESCYKNGDTRDAYDYQNKIANGFRSKYNL